MNELVYTLLEVVVVLFMLFIALIIIGAIVLFIRSFIGHWKKQ